jgi:hypothetical protein
MPAYCTRRKFLASVTCIVGSLTPSGIFSAGKIRAGAVDHFTNEKKNNLFLTARAERKHCW